jgi:hypothetical protein
VFCKNILYKNKKKTWQKYNNIGFIVVADRELFLAAGVL